MSEYLLVPDMLKLLRCSKATLYREVKAGRIPKPFRISAGKSAWLRNDVKRIMETRSAVANEQ